MRTLLRVSLLAASLIGGAILVGLPQARAETTFSIEYGAPPPPPNYARSPRGYVWEPAHWEWMYDRYVWIEGAWLPTRPAYAYREPEWREPEWLERDDRREYPSGRWERDGYRAPNRYDRRPEAQQPLPQASRPQQPSSPSRNVSQQPSPQASRQQPTSQPRSVPQQPVPQASRQPAQPASEWVAMRDGDTGAAMWFNPRTGQYSYVDPATQNRR